jgi:site-specific DNA-methyltransferase (adenine-specific)
MTVTEPYFELPGYYGRVLMDGEWIHALGEWPLYRPGRKVIPGGLEITYVATDRVAWHPAPRSGVATRWLLKWWSDPSDLVVDPFMGSGTTLVAAQAMGRRAVGIEVEERYCELTARRFDQGLFELPGTVA